MTWHGTNSEAHPLYFSATYQPRNQFSEAQNI
jgi:hypothetical protein